MNAESHVDTCYGPISREVMERAAQITLLICDVDGVMSDGNVYQGNSGEELKAFNVRDGYGIRCLLTSDIGVAIITGRKAKLLEDRCATLGIQHLYQGQSNKVIAYQQLLDTLHCEPLQVAYIGDDLIDWPVMKQVGLSVAVADAHPLIQQRAHYTTGIAGGRGAVRELCDIILMAQDKFEQAEGLSI